MSNYQAHIRYKNKDGILVPGVTTVLSVLNKPALVKWANNLGLQGIDSTKYRDAMADIGTLAHYLIMCHLTAETPNTNEYSQEQIDKAENCCLSFYEWEKNHPLEPVLIEEPLVSEEFQFGGTVDCCAKCNGDLLLVDFKTGKGIYESEMFPQLAAYRQLLKENNFPVDNCRILRIGRGESEGFEERVVKNTDPYWGIFVNCLSIYNIRKELKNR